MMDKTPAAPAHLSKESRAIWRNLHREFCFAPGDSVLLEQMLECLDRIRLAQAKIAEEGLVLLSGEVKKRHPAVEAERCARGQLIEIWKTLKLNAADPQDRPRIGRPPGGKKHREMPTWLQPESRE